MGLLDKLEKSIEKVVRKPFNATFKSLLDPIEIASQIKASMDNQVSVEQEQKLVAHRYQLLVSVQDFEALSADQLNLDRKLSEMVSEHIKQKKYSTIDDLRFVLGKSEKLSVGDLELEVMQTEQDVYWQPFIEFTNQKLPLPKGRTRVGRGNESDVKINDRTLSRIHLELLFNGEKAGVRDLGSTNGSLLNGQKFQEGPLVHGDTITCGNTEIKFFYLPQIKEDA
ncbi:MAG: DUF3662 domain-containing protein [Microbacteriaceae bacterium]|nr:DUF3662 domain-containing protein [Microbacteriaceae bacterium]MDR9444362.1 DUF3662 domain-containing protein [Microbacteriaceae bacterium]